MSTERLAVGDLREGESKSDAVGLRIQRPSGLRVERIGAGEKLEPIRLPVGVRVARERGGGALLPWWTSWGTQATGLLSSPREDLPLFQNAAAAQVTASESP